VFICLLATSCACCRTKLLRRRGVIHVDTSPKAMAVARYPEARSGARAGPPFGCDHSTMSIRDFTLTDPVGFTPPGHWGPSHDEPCPCGSGVLAGECHAHRSSGRWRLPPYTPLLTDGRTGFAHNGCYASIANDCSTKLSNEHWLSKGVLLEAGDGQPLRFRGLSWQQAGSEVQIPARRMGSNILCSRHNTALSRLDTTAVRVFRALRRYQRDLRTKPDPHGDEFFLASGEELERWLLKLFWGATEAGVLGPTGQPITELRKTADLEGSPPMRSGRRFLIGHLDFRQ
jgi:hypothetical protein